MPAELSALYRDPVISDAFPLGDILTFLLSRDYDPKTRSADKSLMSISVQPELTDEEALDVEKKVRDIARSVEGGGIEHRVLGDALVDEKISEASSRNIAMLMPIAFAFVIIVLAKEKGVYFFILPAFTTNLIT